MSIHGTNHGKHREQQHQLSQVREGDATKSHIRYIGFGVALGIAMTFATAANYVSREGKPKPSKAKHSTMDDSPSGTIDHDLSIETKPREEKKNKKAEMEIHAIAERMDALCKEFLDGILMCNKMQSRVLVNEMDSSIIRTGTIAEVQLQADLATLDAWKSTLPPDDPLQTDIHNILSFIESFVLKNTEIIHEYRRNRP